MSTFTHVNPKSAMDPLTFIDSMTGHLIWPIVVLVLVLVLHKQIKELLGRLEEGEAAGVKVKLSKDLDTALAKVEEVQASTPIATANHESSPAPDGSGERKHVWHQQLDRVQEAAQTGRVSPRTAVIEGWVWVEAALNNAAEALGLTGPGPVVRPDMTARALVREGRFTPQLAGALTSLRHVRNRASHDREFELSPDAAADYVLACANMIDLVEAATLHITRSNEPGNDRK
ncbi:hypothetical protein ACFWFR_00935 [Oerskovia sp. NPDC060287]|uniref:hypothetical protein n=1 Tax=Oerskovia sp. NPDC060287 TaxID=3347095 RepID=UPI00365FD852